MYGGRLPIPAVKVEDMSTTNREDGKTTIVVLASEPSYSAFGNMVRKWLVCAICAPCCSSDERNVDNCKCLWG